MTFAPPFLATFSLYVIHLSQKGGGSVCHFEVTQRSLLWFVQKPHLLFRLIYFFSWRRSQNIAHFSAFDLRISKMWFLKWVGPAHFEVAELAHLKLSQIKKNKGSLFQQLSKISSKIIFLTSVTSRPPIWPHRPQKGLGGFLWKSDF